jgi:hypothetical protein
VASWSFTGEPFWYEGGVDPSADVNYGFKLTLRDETGREATVNVEQAVGGSALTAESAHRAVEPYLQHDELPSRLVMSREGAFSHPG